MHLKLIGALVIVAFLLVMAWWIRLSGEDTMSNINVVVAAVIIILIIVNRKEL